MAAPLLVLIPNEFYELKDAADVKIRHPHRDLRDFKIVMVAKSSVEEAVVFKWPSFNSLALFITDGLDVLPSLDHEFTITTYNASRIVSRQIDLVDLCFNQAAWSVQEAWLHNHAMGRLKRAMSTITRQHSDQLTQRNRIKADHFYALSLVDLPRHIAVGLTGFPRVAWVSRLTVGSVEVRVPTMASLDQFEVSQTLALPDFNQIFRVNTESARLCLKRILPTQMCFRLRKRRDFWFNQVFQDNIHNTDLPSTSHAGALIGEGVSGVSGAGGVENGLYTVRRLRPEIGLAKVIMVSQIDGGIVCEWPSIKSLASFFKERVDVLPTFNQQCTVIQSSIPRLLDQPIDSVQFCFNHGMRLTETTWLHDLETVNEEMDKIDDDHVLEVQRTYIRPDHFYVINYNALPRTLGPAAGIINFERVAWVSNVREDPIDDGHPRVDVRIASMASVEAFLNSESLAIPEFDQAIAITRAAARLLLGSILPIPLCFRLRKRRDFWINEPQEIAHNSLVIALAPTSSSSSSE